MRLDLIFSPLLQTNSIVDLGVWFSGLISERATPVPIPNTEVKPFSAEGTARAAVWESRTRPGFYSKRLQQKLGAFFFPTLPLFQIFLSSSEPPQDLCFDLQIKTNLNLL